jgi:hypothetical protein
LDKEKPSNAMSNRGFNKILFKGLPKIHLGTVAN